MKQDIKNVLRVLVAIVLGMVVCWLIGGVLAEDRGGGAACHRGADTHADAHGHRA